MRYYGRMYFTEQKSNKKGILFILSAPSGAGKTTLCKRVIDKFSNLRSSISYTTRAKRGDEVDGIDYFFSDKDGFEDMIADGKFLEWAVVHNNLYGTASDQIYDYVNKGNDVLLDIDPQGAMTIKETYKGRAVYIFINTPSFSELKKRLEGRNTESSNIIEERMKIAKLELTYIDKYDYLVINDNIDKALDDISSIYRAETLKIRH